jgi:hypothetical protein
MCLGDDEPFWRQCLEYTNEAIEEHPESALAHIDAVKYLYGNLSGSNDCEFLDVTSNYVFRAELLNAGVDRYVCSKLEEDPLFFDNVFESPLDTVIDQLRWLPGHIKIIVKFLEIGADPNNDCSESGWYHFIQRASFLEHDDHNFHTAVENGLLSRFLKSNARKSILVSLCSAYESSGQNFSPSKLPCTHFMKALFYYPNSHRFLNKMLITLQDFWHLPRMNLVHNLIVYYLYYLRFTKSF